MIRLLAGHRNVFSTIEPAATFAGLCWSDDPNIRNTFDLIGCDADALARSKKVRDLMPLPGTPRDCAEPIIASVHENIIIAMAGLAAELLICGAPSTSVGHASDILHARAAARQICASDVSADALVDWGLSEAVERLRPHKVVARHLADALLAKRTLDDPAEIDRLIEEGMRLQALADAEERRRAWQRTIDGAAASSMLFERIR